MKLPLSRKKNFSIYDLLNLVSIIRLAEQHTRAGTVMILTKTELVY